jgi:transcription antitermination factor NusG
MVLHTKPRQEKRLGEELAGEGLEVFLPLVRHTRVYGHRKRQVELSLFPSYLFVRAPGEAKEQIYRTERVVTIVPVRDQQRLEAELAQVRRAIDLGLELDPFPYLEVGRRARVRSGPMMGLEGLIDKRGPRQRLILVVQTLGRAVCVEVDAGVLEPLD